MLTTSIAMATYNGRSHLREQLDSLAAQTVLPLELVVTDDGSTDDTLDILADFARAAPFPVFVHRNDHRLGYRANFIKCAGLCRGDLIAFCDQDDIWDAEKLAVTTAILAQSNALLVYHTFRPFDPRHSAPAGPVNQQIEVGSPWAKVYGITEVFRRSLLDFSDLWPDSVDNFTPAQPMAHDQWIYFLAHAFGGVSYLDSDLIGYRQHTENICGFQTLKSKNLLSNAINNVGIMASRMRGGRDFAEKRDEMAGHWEGLALGAENRVALVAKIAQRPLGAAGYAPPTAMVRYYEQLHDYYGGRFRIFTAPSRARRLSQLLGLLFRGCYWRQGSRGLRDGVIDFIYGVLA